MSNVNIITRKINESQRFQNWQPIRPGLIQSTTISHIKFNQFIRFPTFKCELTQVQIAFKI